MRRHDWLLQQLPVAMVEDPFLARFLMIFQTLADEGMQHVDQLRHLFDPTVAPDEMVRLLGAWIGIDWIDPSLPDELQRNFVIGYSQIVRWRGTRRGLQHLLELITSAPVTVSDSGGVFLEGESTYRSPHVVVRAQQTGWLTEQDLVRIVRSELPAQVTFELHVGQRQLWPETAALATPTFSGTAVRPEWDPPTLQWATSNPSTGSGSDNGATS